MVNTVGFKIKCNNGGFPIGDNKIAEGKLAFGVVFANVTTKQNVNKTHTLLFYHKHWYFFYSLQQKNHLAQTYP